MLPLIVSGPPGVGKTAVAGRLARQAAMGVHLETDAFFGFVSRLLDPSTPAAGVQNETVVQAYCRAAVEYQQGGYQVYVDGVIGPWLFPLIQPILRSFDYVLLDVGLALAQARNRARAGVISADIVERMHAQFDQPRRAYPAHVVRTDDLSVEDIARRIADDRRDGRYTVGANSI